MTFFRHIIVTIVLACGIAAYASHPIVHNFNRSTYAAGSQNWAVGQTSRGAMVFGNQDGMLVYNSKSWQTLTVDNHTSVRSLYVDSDAGRIYVGASFDFGYFSLDDRGHTVYTSLLETLPADCRDFSEIWNIEKNGNSIWFQGDFNVFCYDGSTTYFITAPKKITCSKLINGVLYLGFIDGDMAWVRGNSLKMVKSASAVNDRICAILDYPGANALVVTPFHGVFSFDGNSLTRFHTDVDDFLIANQTFCAAMNEEKLVFGTVNCGAVVIDRHTAEKSYINTDTGLQNNTVLCAGFDNIGNLWLGLDNGLDYVLLNTPITSLLSPGNGCGAGYASLLDGGRLLLGTNRGLFFTNYPARETPEPPAPRQLLQGQVWSIDTIGGSVFVCGDGGLYVKESGTSFRKMEGVPGAWSVTPLRTHAGKALVSTYDGFFLIAKTAGWHNEGRIAGYSDVGGRPVQDKDGDIWISHWLKGAYRLRLTDDGSAFASVSLYDSSRGFPQNDNNLPLMLDGNLVFSTQRGFYCYDRASDSMKPHPQFGYYGPMATSRVSLSPVDDMWIISPDGVKVARGGGVGRDPLTVDSISYRPLSKMLIHGFYNLDFINAQTVIVPYREGFYSVDMTYPEKVESANSVYISAVTANQDSIVYSGSLLVPRRGLELPYDLNSIRIDYISPEFRSDDDMLYSFFLENYDKDWSPMTSGTSKEYTKLHEGSYNFRVRAVNAYSGHVSEASMPFVVLAPWYRTKAAKGVYILLGLLAFYLLVRFLGRYSRRSADRVAAEKSRELEELKRRARQDALEKDVEIERLKSEQLEHDIMHKSGELSSIIMNVIRKNEILMDIGEHLERIQNEVEANNPKLKRQLEKIRHLINENISHDDDWKNFTENFDIVYQNYLHRLSEAYPALTQTDLRICAYIRMGLSSKDIAPLMNISFRSVEMNRYRLRKKLALERSVNLTDFLSNF